MSHMVSPVAQHVRINRTPLAIVALLIIGGSLYLRYAVGGRQVALYLVGTLVGVSLYHAAFSFPSAWRSFIVDRMGAGLRAQMTMLAVGSALFVPTLSVGKILGMPVVGLVSPAGTSVAVGAFLFGVGMQLGDRCACGTLYTASGGSTRMVVTLLAFVAGSVVATSHMPFWMGLPSLKPLSLIDALGAGPALAVNCLALGGVAGLTVVMERRRHGRLVRAANHPAYATAWLHGPWPLMAGAVVLAVLNFAMLVLSGQPWRITSAFALWGAKAASCLGFDVAHWPYWTSKANAAALAAPLSHDVTSVTNIGIVLGAMFATALAGRYSPAWRVPPHTLLPSVLGGLLLGYGARIAYGSNVGAYFSGIASSSLHGWLWLAAAFLGNVVGIRLRPLLGLALDHVDTPGQSIETHGTGAAVDSKA
jgi:uncharacterized membrane protein YedE/YeeE